MTTQFIQDEAILRVGEVHEVSGRSIVILVDKNKNLSDLFFHGKLLKNVSVGSYIEIKKGFLSMIGKIESEKIIEDKIATTERKDVNRYRRYLTVSLSGYIDRKGRFIGGTRELPLIGNEVFIVTEEIIQLIHQISCDENFSLNFSCTDLENIDIFLPVNGLINSHIAIFGNTGSGKSNTLAALYQHSYAELKCKITEGFESKCRFLLFDFNGEYTNDNCITPDKIVYNLTTLNNNGDKIPLPKEVLLELEMLSVLSDATDKTQKPFLKRVLDFYWHVNGNDNIEFYFRNILSKTIKETLFSSDKIRTDTIIDFFRQLFDEPEDLISDIEFHSYQGKWKKIDTKKFIDKESDIEVTNIFSYARNFKFKNDLLDDFICFMYLQMIKEILSNRSNPEHVSPVINRLNSNKKDIRKIFDTSGNTEFWGKSNFIVVNLNMVNLTMKKTLPLLLSKWAYNNKKNQSQPSTLSIIIDEAHNILSNTSYRESENWKDYRLETFEEIIKEGRKFGVFITLSSQRPNDISPTIISQAHNYFIHRLINQKDLLAIEKAVSYIDRVMEESIPTLPTGTCIFSGVVCSMPLKLRITELDEKNKPRSQTISFDELLPDYGMDFI
ncbi:conserved hypothetical protein [Xenorhabdus bovienii str. kraussei Quebec]|uniref:Helicase HerA central domain-containing protein n=1 Tax=Xenorhabdus bovienii str. kraussei Quebec TaxID=1398203 RepID=A0A077PJA3_XENBV|nr:ATP-binding protein [Xenorhabdus bovienii]CDH20687.1 conserved hypothetical protein [Xenorhabdus bovienii str. kraussei Quebec]